MIREPFNLYEPIRNGPSLEMPACGDRKSGWRLSPFKSPKIIPPPPHPPNTNRPSPRLLIMGVVQDTVKVLHEVSRFLTVQMY